MKHAVFALIDCNNFFVSCERLFRPDLAGKPVVVLSSNDGCAVSRSNEAKDLGIPMGAPAFKYRQTFKDNGVVAFSANFELYGDISRRITALLTTITPRIEIYSVDESFLDLSELPISDYTAWGHMIRDRIEQYIGIPVAIGIAPTKTLAKLASDRAKKQPTLGGALSLINNNAIENHLKALPIEDVWGIGRRLAPVARASGLTSAYHLTRIPPAFGKQLFGGVRGEQLIRELRGERCFSLEREQQLPKSIARTRTFGEDTNEFYVVEAAIASFATQAAFRLRASRQLTRRASLFLTTSRHKPNYQRWGSEVRFLTPTADTGLLISSLITELGGLYAQNVAYHRAGVLLYDFTPQDRLQTDLLGVTNMTGHNRSVSRMVAIDEINNRFGKRKLHYAAEDLGSKWEPKHRLRSPRYTSRWTELPVVRPLSL